MGAKTLLILGSLVLLLAAIPLTVYYSQQQQETQSQAQKSTTLCFATATTTPTPTTTVTTSPSPSPSPSPTPTGAQVLTCTPNATKAQGSTFTADVIVNPGNNTVSTLRLNIVYDATKLSVDSGGFAPNTAAVSQLTETVYATGAITARLGIVINPQVGVDPTKVLGQSTKVGTITFKVLPTAAVGTAAITFGQSLVLSSNPQDGQDEDVLASSTPLSITIGAATSPTPSGTAGGQAPVCTALNVDRTTSGVAPFAVTFTTNGRDPDGTVQKVTFDFGDGPVQDISQTGGIGTNSVSVQVSHTYNNPGTYVAKATLTDNTNAISANAPACSQTITVSRGTGSGTGIATPSAPIGGTSIATPSPTTIVVATATPVPTIADPGPSEVILGVGAVGVVLSIIGGLLFFAL